MADYTVLAINPKNRMIMILGNDDSKGFDVEKDAHELLDKLRDVYSETDIQFKMGRILSGQRFLEMSK